MGTSGSSKGSGSNTPLYPTWLDEPDNAPLPGGDGAADGDGSPDGGAPDAPPDGDAKPRPPVPKPPESGRFQQARTNFSSFAGSRGNDRGALRRAVRDYVRSGAGGSRNAVQRMGASRRAASNVLGVMRSIQSHGVQETLRRINLENLAGRSTEDVFIGLTEVICKDGGSIDEATARDAWLETVAEMERFDIGDLNALTSDQITEIFLTFVAHAIETRLYQEIGINGFKYADSVADIERIDAQFRGYIEGRVRDSFSSDLANLSAMSDKEIGVIVDKTYKEAWELLELWGDREE